MGVGVFSCLGDSWKSDFVARQMVGEFSGGLLHPRTMANLDSKGEGPEGKVRIGRAVGYRKDALIAWMEQRAEQA